MVLWGREVAVGVGGDLYLLPDYSKLPAKTCVVLCCGAKVVGVSGAPGSNFCVQMRMFLGLF